MSSKQTLKKVLFKFLKITAWITGSIVVLLLLLNGIVRLPRVQQAITNKALSIVSEKVDTKISLKHIYINFPTDIELGGLYLEDQQQDTLLYLQELTVDAALWRLLKKEVRLEEINLSGLSANVHRKDSAFNYDFIVEAFASDTTTVADTTASSWKISWEDINLNNISVRYSDSLAGNHAQLNLGVMSITMDEVDLTQAIYKVDEFILSDVETHIVQTRSATVPEGKTPADTLTADTAGFQFDINRIDVANAHARYEHTVQGQTAQVRLGAFQLSLKELDLANQKLDIDEVLLENTFLAYHQLKTDSSERDNAATKSDASSGSTSLVIPWNVTLASLQIRESAVQYYDFSKPMLSNQLDYNHLWLSKINFEAQQWRVDSAHVAGEINLIFPSLDMPLMPLYAYAG